MTEGEEVKVRKRRSGREINRLVLEFKDKLASATMTIILQLTVATLCFVVSRGFISDEEKPSQTLENNAGEPLPFSISNGSAA